MAAFPLYLVKSEFPDQVSASIQDDSLRPSVSLVDDAALPLSSTIAHARQDAVDASAAEQESKRMTRAIYNCRTLTLQF